MECDEHAVQLLEFAKRMLDSAARVMNPATGRSVEIRVGIHSGRVMVGARCGVGACQPLGGRRTLWVRRVCGGVLGV